MPSPTKNPASNPASNSIGVVPLGSALIKTSYPRDHIGPPSFHNGYLCCYAKFPKSEFIKDVRPNDVLSGRGGATNSHSGNRAFRLLVKKHQIDYLRATKRDKPQVAAAVVEKIRKKGGRFLRKSNENSEELLYFDIGDIKAREKTCQALREGAPEILRRNGSSDKHSSRKQKEKEKSLSGVSTVGRTESEEKNKGLNGRRTKILRTTFEAEKKEAVSTVGAPMYIRPSMTLLCRDPLEKPIAIPIDHLEEREREIYLRDFLPPNPSIRKKKLSLRSNVTPVAGVENKRDE